MDKIYQDIIEYAEMHSSKSSDLLYRLERETHLRTLAPVMLSGPLQGQLLRLLSLLVKPEFILEIGTFTGYGTLCLAEGLTQTGQLHTIEPNPEVLFIAEKYFNQSPFNHQIFTHRGKAEEVIPHLTIPFFDLIYIDGGKKDYAIHYDLIIDKIKPGGLILADNVLWSGKVLHPKDEDSQIIHTFNTKIFEDVRVENLLLPIRDGLMVMRRC
jgi:predicted O-methyltransferase YrrM